MASSTTTPTPTTTTTNNTTPTPTRTPQRSTGIKLRIPARSPWPHPIEEEYITFHCDEVGEREYRYQYQEEEDVYALARHDMSTYDVLPTGRLVAGSKRVARAAEGPAGNVDDVLAKAQGFCFGDKEAGEGEGVGEGVVRFEGFRGTPVGMDGFAMDTSESSQDMKTS